MTPLGWILLIVAFLTLVMVIFWLTEKPEKKEPRSRYTLPTSSASKARTHEKPTLNPGARVYYGVDVGSKDGSAVVVAKIGEDGKLLVVDEAFVPFQSSPTIALPYVPPAEDHWPVASPFQPHADSPTLDEPSVPHSDDHKDH